MVMVVEEIKEELHSNQLEEKSKTQPKWIEMKSKQDAFEIKSYYRRRDPKELLR